MALAVLQLALSWLAVAVSGLVQAVSIIYQPSVMFVMLLTLAEAVRQLAAGGELSAIRNVF
jgi:hypothetical protein